MTDEQDRSAPLSVEQIAEKIASDDAGDAANGYLYWLDNHSCGVYYGCCGGGKEVNRIALARLIADAIRAAHAEGVRTGQAWWKAHMAECWHCQNRGICEEVEERATRGDEAHQDTSLLPSITKAKKNL